VTGKRKKSQGRIVTDTCPNALPFREFLRSSENFKTLLESFRQFAAVAVMKKEAFDSLGADIAGISVGPAGMSQEDKGKFDEVIKKLPSMQKDLRPGACANIEARILDVLRADFEYELRNTEGKDILQDLLSKAEVAGMLRAPGVGEFAARLRTEIAVRQANRRDKQLDDALELGFKTVDEASTLLAALRASVNEPISAEKASACVDARALLWKLVVANALNPDLHDIASSQPALGCIEILSSRKEVMAIAGGAEKEHAVSHHSS
jgi:hypothetical protein